MAQASSTDRTHGELNVILRTSFQYRHFAITGRQESFPSRLRLLPGNCNSNLHSDSAFCRIRSVREKGCRLELNCRLRSLSELAQVQAEEKVNRPLEPLQVADASETVRVGAASPPHGSRNTRRPLEIENQSAEIAVLAQVSRSANDL